MATRTIAELVSDVFISEDGKTITIERLDGSRDEYSSRNQLDMNEMEIDNGIYFQDNVDSSSDGVYVSDEGVVSVVLDGEVITKNIYDFQNRMSLELSPYVERIGGREVYSQNQVFNDNIFGNAETEIGVYSGSASQIFTSPSSISLQTEFSTVNAYQDTERPIIDEVFLKPRYYNGYKSEFFIKNGMSIGLHEDGNIYKLEPSSGERELVIMDVDSYSVLGSMFAWLKDGVVTVQRIHGDDKLFQAIPEAIITLDTDVNVFALCDDLYIVGVNDNSIILFNHRGETQTVFGFPNNRIEAISVDKRFNVVYAIDGVIKSKKLYDSILPVTSFVIQSYNECPLEYIIGSKFSPRPFATSTLNLGYTVSDASISSSMELFTITDTALTKYTFAGGNPRNSITETTVSPDTLISPLSVVAIGSYVYVTTIASGTVLMAYDIATMNRQSSQDIDLGSVVSGDNIFSIAVNVNNTISILDSDMRVVIINSIISKVVLSAFVSVTYLTSDSKICSLDNKNIITAHISTLGTNIHTIMSSNGKLDEVYSISVGGHAIPIVSGGRLFALLENGIVISEYAQDIEIKGVN